MKHPSSATGNPGAAPPARGSSWTRAAQPTRGSSWTREAQPARGSSWTRDAQPARGSSWTRTATKVGALLTAATAALIPTAGSAFASMPAAISAAPATAHIVRAVPGQLVATEAAVVAAGGTITRRLAALQTLSAQLTPDAAARLRGNPVVASVVGDQRVKLASEGYDPATDVNSLRNVRSQINGTTAAATASGAGVDVALIDSGVSPVAGLSGSRILHGPDLSFESTNPDLRNKDTFGHGTHMAGIILGNDGGNSSDANSFQGIAPSSRLVSLKVADARGASDVTQVLAAIDWVVEHRQSDGLNIRVLNLSFGTDSSQSYRTDPLVQAVEVAWANGITVVTSAGNQGTATGRLTLPAVDPYVLAVGASDSQGTLDRADDKVASFSSRGDGKRNPDLLAPGRSIQSLRVPGSYIDATYGANGGIDNNYFRGSGTSQAAAVASGAAALLLSNRPSLTPDQVKAALVQSADPIPGVPASAQGGGLINLDRALTADPAAAPVQSFTRSTGAGSIDGSRGSMKLVYQGKTLEGARDIHGFSYDAAGRAKDRAAGKVWVGGMWNKTTWTGTSFAGSSWAGSSWAGSSWAGSSWAGSSWATGTWTGSSWAGSSWAGSSWAGSSWAGSSWASSSWN